MNSLDFFAVFFCYFSLSSKMGVSLPCVGLLVMYKLILERSRDYMLVSDGDFSKTGVIRL